MSLSRRSLLAGGLAIASFPQTAVASGDVVKPILDRLHFVPRAKRIIWLYMAGGPSHVDLFDPKPELMKRDGEPMPASLTEGQQLAQLQGEALIAKSPIAPFKKYGESGLEISTLLPFIGSNVADKMALIRSMRTEQINHDPAHTFMNTGGRVAGRPCLGAWLHYGLGPSSEALPPFVVMVSRDPDYSEAQPVSARQWHSGFLPSRFQGVEFLSGSKPVHYLDSPGVTPSQQGALIEAVANLNTLSGKRTRDSEAATRTAQYELALRMQSRLPDLADIEREPEHIKKLYGLNEGNDEFARNCLMARKLAESGVRMVQLYHRGWDLHSGLDHGLPRICKQVDRATAALILDLEQRGMLDETLVIWGGEFGRTPMSQLGDGRDHHMNVFSMWMVGGGIRGGTSYGASDDFGYHIAENEVHVHDLHATILYLLGIDHEKLSYRFQGRDFRLTDVHGKIVKPIIA